MAYKKIEKFNRLIDFDETPIIEGFPIAKRQGTTKYGDADFLEIQLKDSGEIVSIALGAALGGYDWDSLSGQLVMIEYKGEEDSPNHKGKKYKVFEVFCDEDFDFDSFLAGEPAPAPAPPKRGKK